MKSHNFNMRATNCTGTTLKIWIKLILTIFFVVALKQFFLQICTFLSRLFYQEFFSYFFVKELDF